MSALVFLSLSSHWYLDLGLHNALVPLTTRNIHFYNKNLNDESETVIEDRLLWRTFLFRHKSVVTILQPSLSMTKSGIVTKNVIEEHRVSSQITRATHLWRSLLILWWTGLRRWTNYTSMTNNIQSVTNDALSKISTRYFLHPTCTCRTCSYSSVTLAIRHKSFRSILSPYDVYLWYPSPSDVDLWDLQLLIRDAYNSS
jgi:hypothetical protein